MTLDDLEQLTDEMVHDVYKGMNVSKETIEKAKQLAEQESKESYEEQQEKELKAEWAYNLYLTCISFHLRKPSMSVAYASVGQAIEIFYFHDYIFNPEIAKNFLLAFWCMKIMIM